MDDAGAAPAVTEVPARVLRSAERDREAALRDCEIELNDEEWEAVRTRHSAMDDAQLQERIAKEG